jgi:hypothetical protein
VSDCVCVCPAPVAFTVTIFEPNTAVAEAFNVNTLLPFPGDAMLVGEKLAVTPVGRPITESTIDDLKPFTAPVVRVSGTEVPGATVTLLFDSASVKYGTTTVKFNACVVVELPPFAVTVTV